MPFSSQESTRRQLDALKQSVSALPVGGATINTNAIDLESPSFPATEEVSFLASIQSANANSGNAATLSIQLQHSATNVSANFVNVPGTGPVTIASNGAVYPATNNIQLATPDTLLQFVRLQASQTAGGSASTNAANITFALAF